MQHSPLNAMYRLLLSISLNVTKVYIETTELIFTHMQPTDVYGALTHTQSGELEAELFPEAMTQFWTLDMQCFYNPAASMHNLVRDCESEQSICMRDAQTSKCTWDLNNDFMECFKQRGISVAYRHNPNSAAVRRPSDCKYLQSRKLKKKCLRNLRKKYKARKKQGRRIDQD